MSHHAFHIYSSKNHEIHYLMSFIGGCIEIISFIYLYKALIGYMTANMIFGIASLIKGDMNFDSIYHISIIFIWMALPVLHHFILDRKKRENDLWYVYATALTVNCILLIAFIFIGSHMISNGQLGSIPTPIVLPLVTIGLVFMYIQNFVIRNGGTMSPTSTSVVTTTYVLMMSSLSLALFDRQRSIDERGKYLSESWHYILVITHFFVGALITGLLSYYFNFYSLIPALLILLFLTIRIWIVLSKKT